MSILQTPQKIKTKRRIRARILLSGRPFVKIVRSNRYIRALVMNKEGRILTEASTRSLDIEGSKKNVKAATALSEIVKQKCEALGFKEMAFDRSSHQYHGVLAALVEPLKKEGILL